MDDELKARAAAVAEVAGRYADQVDRDARFPHEAFEAIREQRLLGLLISEEEGGEGRGAADVGRVTETIARACGNTGMIFAMHHNQVSGLVRHGLTEAFVARRKAIAGQQLLLASATTEIGIGGDIRRSTCAVEPDDDGRFVLHKNAPVISYAEAADVILVTARKDPDAAPSDQVLVYAEKSGLTLERTSEWDTLGFRGTCSPGYQLTSEGSLDAILPEAFADISARTMLPCSHMFWASVWLGIATEAVGKARSYVQKAARRSPGTVPPGALRLAELEVELQKFTATVHEATARFDSMAPGDPAYDSVPFAVSMNGLKVIASTGVVDIVGRALLIVGIMGYREDSPMRMGRLLRDSYGAMLMVNNDRILDKSATLELVNRGELA